MIVYIGRRAAPGGELIRPQVRLLQREVRGHPGDLQCVERLDRQPARGGETGRVKSDSAPHGVSNLSSTPDGGSTWPSAAIVSALIRTWIALPRGNQAGVNTGRQDRPAAHPRGQVWPEHWSPARSPAIAELISMPVRISM